MPRLLWFDCSGGLIVGGLMFVFAAWAAPLFRLPEPLFHVIASANVAYGCYALFLARRPQRSVAQVAALALANLAWGVACVVGVVLLFDQASIFGLAHMIAEAGVVFALGTAEWRHRHRLAAA